MKRLELTYDIAMAVSRDAANRHARKHGRQSWSVDDYNVACSTFAKLYGDAYSVNQYTDAEEAMKQAQISLRSAKKRLPLDSVATRLVDTALEKLGRVMSEEP